MRTISAVFSVQSASSSGLAKKRLDYLHILVRLFVGGQVSALFEDDELRSWDRLVDVPRGERSDVHVVSTSDDHGGELELRQFRSEVERSGCLLDRGGDLRG